MPRGHRGLPTRKRGARQGGYGLGQAKQRIPPPGPTARPSCIEAGWVRSRAEAGSEVSPSQRIRATYAPEAGRLAGQLAASPEGWRSRWLLTTLATTGLPVVGRLA